MQIYFENCSKIKNILNLLRQFLCLIGEQFSPGKTTPDFVLGVAFESGNDEKHFCKPTSVAVSERTGDFFVADGYCNSRILKFSSDGKLLQIIGKCVYFNRLIIHFCKTILLT